MTSQQRRKTARKISMPPRGSRPGFKIGRTLKDGTRLLYWIAAQVVRDHMGFPDPSIPLPREADEATLDLLCQQHTARLRQHIQQAKTEANLAATRTRYDGTVRAACRIYQEHPLSRFHRVKYNTRNTYVTQLKLIERTVGARLVRNLTVLDVQHWYDEWRKPPPPPPSASDEEIAAWHPPERIDRAHDTVSMFRTVLWFCTALRHADCKQLAEELRGLKFEGGAAREQELTFTQAAAFVRTAIQQGNTGIIPMERARVMAIAVAAQFETLLRQKDIIGEWAPAKPGTPNALYLNDRMWTGYFTWENFPGWRWRTKTSKSKFRAAAQFDLTNYGLLFPLLESVPHADRVGAVVKGPDGLPIKQPTFGRWFREIARAAGIPDEVWNMDTRAGGATEAVEAGAAFDAVSDALTHSDKQTTVRYIRRRKTNIASVAEARQRKRAADEEQ